ncbi:DNA-processing protein DprA [Roseicitreum antarcticum]|nr:DNA-processing protein DprA [Roseicitreum antarcticum]
MFSSNPPFTPPTTEEDRLAWLRLIRSSRVGPATFYRLMQDHGSAQVALDALPGIAQHAGLDRYVACPRDVALREIDAARQVGAKMACFGTPHYPTELATLPDAPPVLWCMGRRDPVLRPMIAIVGARNASSLGTRMARKLAEGLGHFGYTIVSGLARGIDTAAHHAALKTGTIAVMAGGVDVIYPPENAVLAAAIADQGLRVSDQPMGMQPQARHFPRRNRLISGLALGVVVVEAAEKSGSLITARDALDQGREVMAVPGHPVDARAAGCNALIRDGATLVRGSEDVLEVLRPYRPATRKGLQEAATLDELEPDHDRTRRTQADAVRPEGMTLTAGPAASRQRIMVPSVAGQAFSGQPPPVQPASGQSRRQKSPLGHRQPDAAETVLPPGQVQKATAGHPPQLLHNTILSRLGPSPMAEDQLIRDLALPPAMVLQELLTLELSGSVQRHSGGMVSRA